MAADIPEYDESNYDGVFGGVVYKGRNCIVIGMKELKSKIDGEPKRFVDIREHFWLASEGIWQHTGKGVTIPLHSVEEFQEVFERLRGLME
jgi:hypothetical protein